MTYVGASESWHAWILNYQNHETRCTYALSQKSRRRSSSHEDPSVANLLHFTSTRPAVAAPLTLDRDAAAATGHVPFVRLSLPISHVSAVAVRAIATVNASFIHRHAPISLAPALRVPTAAIGVPLAVIPAYVLVRARVGGAKAADHVRHEFFLRGQVPMRDLPRVTQRRPRHGLRRIERGWVERI